MSKKLNKKKLNKIIRQNSFINRKEHTEPFKLSFEPYTEDISYEDDDIAFYMLYKAHHMNEIPETRMVYEIPEGTFKKINGIRTYMLYLVESILNLPDSTDDFSNINDWLHFSKELLDMSCRPLIRMNEVAQETIENDGMSLNQYTIFKNRIRASSYGCSINEFLAVRFFSARVCNTLEESLKTGNFSFQDSRALIEILHKLLQKSERMADNNAIKHISYIVNVNKKLIEWNVLFHSEKKPSFYSLKYPDIEWTVDIKSDEKVHEFYDFYMKNLPFFSEESINCLVTYSKTKTFFHTIKEGKEWLSFAPLLQGIVTPIEIELKRIVAYKTGIPSKNLLFNDAINEGHKLGVLTREQKYTSHAIRKSRNTAAHTGKITENEYTEIEGKIVEQNLLHVIHNYINLNRIP